ncbi:hypothetical protein NC653_031909 [Populus alba x Populus x berolinensis]|uniref:Uncharacterized protein n=2 Tax=Populus TaxID=3689 RepID=A0A4U5QPN9_POPAL|nr:hypothetical protein NC653_031909 [Populus alba x Populus x berolinensis]TKS12863.1 hypothetical protein D5086_0000059190 [Populus alba]
MCGVLLQRISLHVWVRISPQLLGPLYAGMVLWCIRCWSDLGAALPSWVKVACSALTCFLFERLVDAWVEAAPECCRCEFGNVWSFTTMVLVAELVRVRLSPKMLAPPLLTWCSACCRSASYDCLVMTPIWVRLSPQMFGSLTWSCYGAAFSPTVDGLRLLRNVVDVNLAMCGVLLQWCL